MREPNVSDEELMALGRALLDEGRLSWRALGRAAGGGDTGRLVRITRELKASGGVLVPGGVSTEVAAEAAQLEVAAVDLPSELLRQLQQTAVVAVASLRRIRCEEGERSRAMEAALRDEHAAEVSDLQGRCATLEQEVTEEAGLAREAEDALAAATAEIQRLTGQLEESGRQIERLHDRHRTERAQLRADVQQAHDAAQQAERDREQATAAASDAATANRELRTALAQGEDRLRLLQEALDARTQALAEAAAQRDRARQTAAAARRSEERLRRCLAAAQGELTTLQARRDLLQQMDSRLRRLIHAAPRRVPASRSKRRAPDPS